MDADAEAAYAKESHLGIILGVQTTLTVFAVTAVALRLYVRIKIIKNTGSDDWTMAAAAVCAITGWALFVFQSQHGLGRHAVVISATDRIKLSQATFWQVIICSSLGIALVKISLALNLLRLSLMRWYIWSLWASIVFVSAYSFMGAMTFFLHCKPMEAHWDTRIKDAKCYPMSLFVVFALINTSFNIFTDVLFATLPIPIIWRLQMKRRVRAYLTGVLSLGYVAVGMGIVKTIWQLAYPTLDDTYFNDSILFWGLAQFNTAILAASIPSLKPLLNRVLHLSSTRSRGQSGSRSHTYHTGSHSIGGGRNQVWSKHRGDQYALEELESNDSSKKSDRVTGIKRSSSQMGGLMRRAEDEQAILEGWPVDPKGRAGIWKTTEVTVQ